jgi:hypothetical protein
MRVILVWFWTRSSSNLGQKFDCGAVPYGRATTDSANAAQVDRVNVAKGFRQTQKLQVVKSTQRSEISRPNFNQVFRASLSTSLSISASIASTVYFWRLFENAENPVSETDPETSNCYITKTPRGISSFLYQSLVLDRRYRNTEFDLPEFNTKNVTVGIF